MTTTLSTLSLWHTPGLGAYTLTQLGAELLGASADDALATGLTRAEIERAWEDCGMSENWPTAIWIDYNTLDLCATDSEGNGRPIAYID
jgi:hypothetical protein